MNSAVIFYVISINPVNALILKFSNECFNFAVDDIQVACYKILNTLFQLGTDPSIYKDR